MSICCNSRVYLTSQGARQGIMAQYSERPASSRRKAISMRTTRRRKQSPTIPLKLRQRIVCLRYHQIMSDASNLDQNLQCKNFNLCLNYCRRQGYTFVGASLGLLKPLLKANGNSTPSVVLCQSCINLATLTSLRKSYSRSCYSSRPSKTNISSLKPFPVLPIVFTSRAVVSFYENLLKH